MNFECSQPVAGADAELLKSRLRYLTVAGLLSSGAGAGGSRTGTGSRCQWGPEWAAGACGLVGLPVLLIGKGLGASQGQCQWRRHLRGGQLRGWLAPGAWRLAPGAWQLAAAAGPLRQKTLQARRALAERAGLSASGKHDPSAHRVWRQSSPGLWRCRRVERAVRSQSLRAWAIGRAQMASCHPESARCLLPVTTPCLCRAALQTAYLAISLWASN
jgi:hypothetical protein